MATDSGWRADPFGLHEERFFNSDDVPTPLVRDGGRFSFNNLPEPYRSHPQPLRSPSSVPDLSAEADRTGFDATSAGLIAANPAAPPLDDEDQHALVSNHDLRPQRYAFCPRCGSQAVADGSFCGECGQSLSMATGEGEGSGWSRLDAIGTKTQEASNPTRLSMRPPPPPLTTSQILPPPPSPLGAAPAEVHPPAGEVKTARSKLALYTSPAFVLPMVVVAAIVIIATVLSSR